MADGVQTPQYQTELNFKLANKKYVITLYSSSVPVTMLHPHVPSDTGRRQLHCSHPASPDPSPYSLVCLRHQFKPALALASQIVFSKYVKQTLLQIIIHHCWVLVTLESTSFASCYRLL